MDFSKEREGADDYVYQPAADAEEEDEEPEVPEDGTNEDGDNIRSISEEELSLVYDTQIGF